MYDKKGDITAADIFSIIFTFLLLVVYVIVFLVPGVVKDRDQEIEVIVEVASFENVFVIESYLDSPYNSGKVSDVLNSYLVDDDDSMLEIMNSDILGNVYGDCYGFSFGDFEKGDLSSNKICIDYPNYGDIVELCLDISEFDSRLGAGEEVECF